MNAYQVAILAVIITALPGCFVASPDQNESVAQSSQALAPAQLNKKPIKDRCTPGAEVPYDRCGHICLCEEDGTWSCPKSPPCDPNEEEQNDEAMCTPGEEIPFDRCGGVCICKEDGNGGVEWNCPEEPSCDELPEQNQCTPGTEVPYDRCGNVCYCEEDGTLSCPKSPPCDPNEELMCTPGEEIPFNRCGAVCICKEDGNGGVEWNCPEADPSCG